MSDRIRVVLGFDADSRSFARLAVIFHWRNYRHIHDAHKVESVFCTDDEASWIHYVEDLELDVKYMLFIGPRADEFARALRKEVRHQPRRVLLQRLREESDLTGEDRRKVLYQLAVDAVEHGFDQEVFDLYRAALDDPDPFIRDAAARGAAYLGWPELAR